MMLEQYESLCEKRQKIIVSQDAASGNPSQHRAYNQSENCVRQYCLDDHTILQNSVRRCDYLLLNCDKKRAYFIELKGKHIEKAKEQIESSERLLNQDIKGYTIFYRIIYRTGTQSIRSSAINHWIKQLGRVGNIQVAVVKQLFYEEKIDF